MGNLLADFGRASGSLQALTNQLGQRKALQVREKQFAMQRQRQNMLDDRAAAVYEQQIEKATRQNEKEKEKFDYNNESVPITAQLESMPGGQSGPMAQMTITRLEDAGVIEKDPNRSTPELPVYKGIRHELAWEMDGITADKNFIRDSSVKSIKHLQGLINAENQEMAKKFGGVPKEKRDKNNEYIASTERIAGYDNTISALEKDLGIMNRAELTDKQKSDTIMQRQLAVDAEKRKRQAAEDKEKREREQTGAKLTKGTPYTAEDGTRRVPWFDKQTGELVNETNLGKALEKESVYDLNPNEVDSLSLSLEDGNLAPKQISARLGRNQVIAKTRETYPKYNFEMADANYDWKKSQINMRTVNFAGGALPRLSKLDEQLKALPNVNINTINRIMKVASIEFGYPEYTNFESNRNAIVQEINAALSGSGQGSDLRIQIELDNLKSARSPQQITGAIGNLREALIARLDVDLSPLYPIDVIRGEKTMGAYKAEMFKKYRGNYETKRNNVGEKQVSERRKAPDGRILVKYTDGTIGEE